jgi:hypothetical protein
MLRQCGGRGLAADAGDPDRRGDDGRALTNSQRVEPMDDVVEVIQLALAPVFLLTAIGALLGVLSSRLTRIVDRARELEDRFADGPEDLPKDAHRELRLLANRARLTNWAITLSVLSALQVSVAIVTLFVGSYFHELPVLPVALLVTGALAALVVSLLFFLREVFLATANLRIGVK